MVKYLQAKVMHALNNSWTGGGAIQDLKKVGVEVNQWRRDVREHYANTNKVLPGDNYTEFMLLRPKGMPYGRPGVNGPNRFNRQFGTPAIAPTEPAGPPKPPEAPAAAPDAGASPLPASSSATPGPQASVTNYYYTTQVGQYFSASGGDIELAGRLEDVA